MGVPVGLVESLGATGAIAAFDAVIKSTNIGADRLRAYTMEGDRILLTIEGQASLLGEIETAVDHAVDAIKDVQGSELISSHVLSNVEVADWDRIEEALSRYTHPFGRVLIHALQLDFGPIAAGNPAEKPGIIFSGAGVNDSVAVRAPRPQLGKPPAPGELDIRVHTFAYVTATDTVTLQLFNSSDDIIKPKKMVYRLILTKY